MIATRSAGTSSGFVPGTSPEVATILPKHRWGLGAFFLVEAILLLSAIFVSALMGPAPADGRLPVRDVLIGTIAPMFIATTLALVITVVRGNGPFRDLQLAWHWADVKVGLKLGGIGLVLTSVGAFIWTKVVGPKDGSSAVTALVEDQRMSVTAAIVMFVYLWLIGPICEEIIFRGLLWGAVERLSWTSEKAGRIAAFAISTAVFALSHLEPLRTTLLLVMAIPIGLARFFTGRLPASIIAHQINNFVPALGLLLTTLGVLSV